MLYLLFIQCTTWNRPCKLNFKFNLQFKMDTVCFHLPSTSYELLIEQAPRIAPHGPPTDGSSFTSLWKRAWTFFFFMFGSFQSSFFSVTVGWMHQFHILLFPNAICLSPTWSCCHLKDGFATFLTLLSEEKLTVLGRSHCFLKSKMGDYSDWVQWAHNVWQGLLQWVAEQVSATKGGEIAVIQVHADPQAMLNLKY